MDDPLTLIMPIEIKIVRSLLSGTNYAVLYDAYAQAVSIPTRVEFWSITVLPEGFPEQGQTAGANIRDVYVVFA